MTAAQGACFYRVRLPMEALAAHGHDVTLASAMDGVTDTGGYPGCQLYTEPVTLSAMSGYDVVLGQRLNKHAGLDIWRRARAYSRALVYETDDDCYSVAPDNWAAYHVFQQPDILDAITHAAEVADLVTVTTEHLAGVMREHNPNVAVLPNCVPDWLLAAERTQHDRPCLGWVGGASHGSDVGLIVRPVQRFLKRFPGWDFRLGGTDYRPTFGRDRVLYADWVPVNEQPEAYYQTLGYDIGLAPLVDTPFSRSKSCIKVVEYAALGIPAVASDCGVYREFIRHGENGFLARYEHEWLKYLSELAGDEALRARMGAQARQDARGWAIGANWQRWETAYAALFPRR